MGVWSAVATVSGAAVAGALFLWDWCPMTPKPKASKAVSAKGAMEGARKLLMRAEANFDFSKTYLFDFVATPTSDCDLRTALEGSDPLQPRDQQSMWLRHYLRVDGRCLEIFLLSTQRLLFIRIFATIS